MPMTVPGARVAALLAQPAAAQRCLAVALSLVVLSTWLPTNSAIWVNLGVVSLLVVAGWLGYQPNTWAQLVWQALRRDYLLWTILLAWAVGTRPVPDQPSPWWTALSAVAGYYLLRWYRTNIANWPHFGVVLLGTAWVVQVSLSSYHVDSPEAAVSPQTTLFIVALPLVSYYIVRIEAFGPRLVGLVFCALAGLLAALSAPQLVLAALAAYLVYRFLGPITHTLWRCAVTALTPCIVLALALQTLTPRWYASQQQAHQASINQLISHPWGRAVSADFTGSWAQFIATSGLGGVAITVLLMTIVWRVLIPQIRLQVPLAAPLGFTWLLLVTAAIFGQVVAHHQVVIAALILLAWSKPVPLTGAARPGSARTKYAAQNTRRPKVNTKAPQVRSVQAQLRAQQRQQPPTRVASSDAEKVLYLPIADDLNDLVGPPK